MLSHTNDENNLSLGFSTCSSMSRTTHLRLPSYVRDEMQYRQRPSSGRTAYMRKQYKNLTSRSTLRRCQSQDKLCFKKEVSFPNKLTIESWKPNNTKTNKTDKQKISPSKGVERKFAIHFGPSAELDDVIDEFVQEPNSQMLKYKVQIEQPKKHKGNIIKRPSVFPSSPEKCDTKISSLSEDCTISYVNYYSGDWKALEMAKQSLKEEMEEFALSSFMYIRYPDYIRDKEILLIRDVAQGFNLGIEEGPNATFVYRLSTEGRGFKTLFADGSNDVSVNIRDFRENHNALQRLNSFKGNRRNMLWKLASTPTIKVPIGNDTCTNGVYMVRTTDNGSNIAMYKPIQEEKFIRRGIEVGEGAVREEAAYVLDAIGFSRVPPTTVASINRNDSSGAIQQFMLSKMGSLENFGMPRRLEDAIKFVSVQEIQRISILDIRVFNTDRHLGNVLLLGDEAPYGLVPIDHGCILPSWYALGEAQFGWLSFPQVEEPLTDESMSYIMNINIDDDIMKLRQLKIREECIVTLKICTLLLKMAAKNNKSLFWLGNFMQRKDCMDLPSDLEKLIKQTCDICHIPLSFEKNQYGEYESTINRFGILSRRPSQKFYDVMSQIFYRILLNDVQQN